MREVMSQLLEVLSRKGEASYCRLVETRGSTPQKAGAAMLIHPDGSQCGTLGGGCVEAEVKRRPLAVLQDGQSEIARFQLDSDYGWDDGLICGGRMHILVEPVRPTDPADYFRQLGACLEAARGFTEAIVFDSDASGLPAPATYLFDAETALLAQRHGTDDAIRVAEIQRGLKPLGDRPLPHAEQGIAYLPVLPRCRLIIVGGGHVGQAVGQLAADLDFDVWVVDDREDMISESRFPQAQRRIAGRIDEVLPHIEVTPDTYCLIVTRGHNHDEEALFLLAERGARYVGMIGSRRKIRMIFDDLLQEGIDEAALAQVHAPVGIDIGSQTVPEIAVSICAELVAHRNIGDGKQAAKAPTAARE